MDYVTLLLVDDDAELLRMLQRRLELDGYDVMTAAGGRLALAALDRRLPDLAVIDLLMPGMDGFELAEQIKRRGDLPLIFLTSVGDAKTRIDAIRHYAEDYVLKPFDYEELIARVQRILRRTVGSNPVSDPLVVVDAGLTLDFGRAEAHRPAGVVKLSVTEAKLLYHLVHNAGQTLPVGTLVAKIWGYADEAGPEALRVAIYRLRRKVEPDPRHPQYILTERDVGYRFVQFRPR
ncbi:MAG TPA: response regulator transcription factor [Anaerolineae bacterium]|nr:response regulator transcription factor [Anaerolineae bacterium]